MYYSNYNLFFQLHVSYGGRDLYYDWNVGSSDSINGDG